jgi:hypothetical protein
MHPGISANTATMLESIQRHHFITRSLNQPKQAKSKPGQSEDAA